MRGSPGAAPTRGHVPGHDPALPEAARAGAQHGVGRGQRCGPSWVLRASTPPTPSPEASAVPAVGSVDARDSSPRAHGPSGPALVFLPPWPPAVSFTLWDLGDLPVPPSTGP